MARTLEKLENVAKVCRESHKVEAKVVQFDFATLSSKPGVEALQGILEELSGLDIAVLVNNVGKANASFVHEHSVENIYQMIHVNICSQTFMSVFTVPLLLRRFEREGRRSAIINFSSSSVVDMDPQISVYAATKAYNYVLSECMRKEYAGKIDILTVLPRNVKTQMNSGRYTFTILPNEHAKSVLDHVGRDHVTWGHYSHGLQNWLLGIPPAKYLINRTDNARFQQFLAEKKAKQEAEKQSQ